MAESRTVYGELGSQQPAKSYQAYVSQGIDQGTSEFYSLKQTPSVLGDRKFRDMAQKRALSLDREIDKKGLKAPVSLVTIIKTVATYYQVNGAEIKKTKRGKGKRNIPRWMAMKLCQEVGSAKLTEIAALFNVGHYATVSKTISRLNQLMGENQEYEKDYNILSQDLTP